MPEMLLRTKVFLPLLRPNLVPRPHLIARLNQGLQPGHKLTLVSAPAGFGKTTLVSEWVAGAGRPAAWLSLDERDNDPVRFLAYLVAALQTVAPNVGEGVSAMLQAPQPPPIESSLTALLNEITTVRDHFILVLDDYHVIDTASVDQALAFLLEHWPPPMHLVIATREDPQLPLARLRARSQMTELRASDLRFTPAEAAEFLNRVMDLNLSAEAVAALETRTEGWIAGLQLAALSMQRHQDAARFIQSFTGSHQFVLDFLLEEVLQQQHESVQTFLLQTSILDRLSGPLCDAVRMGGTRSLSSPTGTAVSGQEDGQAFLEMLDHANLFIVPLDHERRWYRYHHLLADLLRQRLRQTRPDLIPTLHLRASGWYAQNDLPADAVRHALAAADFERAAGLIEMAWQAMDSSFQSMAWLGWAKELPDQLIRNRPVLSTQIAWALWLEGELEASEARLRDAERWLDPIEGANARPGSAAAGMVVVDEAQFRTLPAAIALARAHNAQAKADVSGTVKYAELALRLTSEGDHLGQAQATVSLGFAHWANGDLGAAREALTDWINNMQQAGNFVFAIASTFALADILVAQGRLREAVRAYQHALRPASTQDEDVRRVVAHLHLGLAMLYHEMGDQAAATRQLLQCQELGPFSALPDWPNRWCLAQAQLKESSGDLNAALDLLDEAKRLYVRNSLPDTRPIEALKARVYVRQGRLSRALAWANEQGLSVDDKLSYLREFEHVTLARVLIAEYRSDPSEHAMFQATGLLERLLMAAEKGRRIGSVIDILVLQALAYEAQGNIPLALARLERALALAEPEGYVRTFVDEGAAMAVLLERLAPEDGLIEAYVRQLLDAFADKARYPTSPSPRALVDPLSKREREVLKYLTTELSGPEIARELMVSMNTLRTHTKNIYAKLGVNRRRDAVNRATELSLI